LQDPLPEDASDEDKILFGNSGDFMLFTALSQLMRIVGYDLFSMRDIHSPTSQRLCHQLSAVLNMAKFKEEQLKFYAALDEPVRQKCRTCIGCY
jgi:hypothetical protein